MGKISVHYTEIIRQKSISALMANGRSGARMAEICCRRCGNPDCHGCNMYILEQKLKAGGFDSLMNENRAIRLDVDVAPVVRCKECANKFDWPWCGMFPDDGYCSAGARMDGDGE